MHELVAQMFITLDGVVQSPGDPNEDRSGGFRSGGWHMPFHNSVVQEWIVRNNEACTGYLLGRRTYDFFRDFWPQATVDQVGELAHQMRDKPKWVVSATLDAPLPWANARLCRPDPDPASAVQELLATPDGDLLLLGSTKLARTMLASRMVDRLHLILDPVVLGSGARLFPRGAHEPRRWELVENRSTPSGAALLTYDAAASR